MRDRIPGTTLPTLEAIPDPGDASFVEAGALSWVTSSIARTTAPSIFGQ